MFWAPWFGFWVVAQTPVLALSSSFLFLPWRVNLQSCDPRVLSNSQQDDKMVSYQLFCWRQIRCSHLRSLGCAPQNAQRLGNLIHFFFFPFSLLNKVSSLGISPSSEEFQMASLHCSVGLSPAVCNFNMNLYHAMLSGERIINTMYLPVSHFDRRRIGRHTHFFFNLYVGFFIGFSFSVEFMNIWMEGNCSM